LSSQHDSWAGPITAGLSWVAIKVWPDVAHAADWLVATGLPLVLGVSTVWWTITKARRETEARLREREQAAAERARRLAIEGLMHADKPSVWAGLLRRPPITGAVPLDSLPADDHRADAAPRQAGSQS